MKVFIITIYKLIFLHLNEYVVSKLGIKIVNAIKLQPHIRMYTYFMKGKLGRFCLLVSLRFYITKVSATHTTVKCPAGYTSFR